MMKTGRLRWLAWSLVCTGTLGACAGESSGDGDDEAPGDGDGDTGGMAGDGDGDTGGMAGDGDGDTGGMAGDGDGDTGGMAGDGDGDMAGAMGDGDAPICERGETRTCVGPAACTGGQVCREDQSGWHPCDCGPIGDGDGDTGGGTGSGGDGSGGDGSGGDGSGGDGSGGDGSGGDGSGGDGSGGDGSGGTSGYVDDPPGFWRYGELAGCAWVAVDSANVGTTISPADFTGRDLDEPYCASGTVGAHPSNESLVLVGFHLDEDPASADCTYDPLLPATTGLPSVDLSEGTAGIALNIEKRGADTSFPLFVQLRGPDAATQTDQRWCAPIDILDGKLLIPWTDFHATCGDENSAQYAGEPIASVAFLVAGSPAPEPFDFCIHGWTPGYSASDAPDTAGDIGEQSGTVGSDHPDNGDFDRKKVLIDGDYYIMQNNNWGNPHNTDLILGYLNNSFTLLSGTGTSPGGGNLASFPSIYLGANGNTADGYFQTSATDNLPEQISELSGVPTTFAWSGSTTQFSTTYELWFADAPPSASYLDAQDGLLRIWLHDPSNHQPAGNLVDSASIADIDWDIWVGPRGEGPHGYNDATTVTFVAPSDVTSESFDLLDFMEAAWSFGITSDMYLTDIFFGFEIWEGGAGGNLSVDSFTCEVQ